MSCRKRIVGIDLGTTHTVVAVAEDDGIPRIVPLSQLVTGGETRAAPLLPSVLFAPTVEERGVDPWGDAPWIIGAHARTRAQEAPSRAVTSPKSWLCHAALDRLAPTLPWGADPADTTLPRVSPVEASRRILSHVRSAMDAASPSHPLADQEIVLTVPASFDEVARELTVRAAADAGLTVRLLEEPLAAFHDHLASHGTHALRTLVASGRGEAFVLVCDVGGGTTDLTLVRVARSKGDVELERVAVGRHLLLGGDNMDLALAHTVEQRLIEPPDRLAPSLFAELVLACRSAKERLLGADPADSVPLRVLSRGSSLVGRTLSTELRKDEVEALVLDGFFPIVAADAAPSTTRGGLVGFGLPYEHDPAVTRHVAAFLRRHLPEGARPDAVLLNGGVFLSAIVRERLLDALEQLTGSRATELPASDPDLAVARGAVAYGLSLAGRGHRVGGGSARGYYVGLATDGGDRRAVCVVPRGTTEGDRHVVTVPGLSLVVGEPARFELFSSDGARHTVGTIVTVDRSFDSLPAMSATFDAPGATRASRVPVQLEGELSAVGTLDVACIEVTPGTGGDTPRGRRFRLAFDLKPRVARPSTRPPPPSVRPGGAKLEAASDAVLRVFGKGRADADPRDARHLLRELERILGERATWTTEVSRAVYDLVLVEAKARKRSVEHERAFWMLAGYCLRPGYGHPLDERRVARIVPLFAELLAFPDEARGWQQLWIAWRRLAGGLAEPAQCSVRDLVDPFLSTDEVKPKKRKGVRPQAVDEMLELAAALECVPAPRRADLGRWILERTWTDRDPRLWTLLGRVGARVPTYASAHHVVAPGTVERWLDHLMREKWAEVPTAARAAMHLSRVTGDRARDVAEPLRRELARRLEAVHAPPEWARAVLELVPIEAVDQAEFFGESLPVGLVLAAG